MENLKVHFAYLVKTLIFSALLITFCVLFLRPVMTQYSEKYTNIARISKTADKVEVPTFSICTGWKTSIMDEYKITSQFLWTPTSNESNLPIDATIEKLYSNITYKLNEDFAIGLAEGSGKKPKVRFLYKNDSDFDY